MVVPVSFGTRSVSCTIYCNSMVRDRGEGGREGGRERDREENGILNIWTNISLLVLSLH